MLCATVLFTTPAGAADNIYSGMTANELAAFAQGEGWQAQINRLANPVVTIRRDGRPIRIEMFDCDENNRCKAGVIRDLTYYFVKPDSYGFWHWNLALQGATGFGPSYVTLQRYLHFNGVTDQYLRDVVGQIWPRAAQSFWREVEKRYEAERRTSPPDEKE